MKGNGFSFADRCRSFGYAFAGVCRLFRCEHNAWIHGAVGVCVIVAGFLFQLSSFEWIAVAIVIGGVLGAEAFNSAIEELADHVSPGYSESIKHVKDLSAAGVLLVSIAAAVTGLIVFLPKLIHLFY